MNRLKEKYLKTVRPQLKEKLGCQNDLAVPQIKKVVVNVGLGATRSDDNFIKAVENTLARITGQKPVLTLAKKSIAGFKIRQGQTVGIKVTLRGERMYDFIDKIIGVALPRVRDFRGLDEKIIDQAGNLSLGLKEHLVVPEINPDEIDRVHGLEIVITTSAHNQVEALELFKLLDFPFKKKENK